MRKTVLVLVCVSCHYTIVQGTEGEFTATADVASTSAGSSSAGSGSNSAGSSTGSNSTGSSSGQESSGQPTTGPDPGSSSSTGNPTTTDIATTGGTTSSEGSSSTGQAVLPCGGNFSQEWCPQVGPVDQFTRCEAVLNDGKTCLNPEIRYGSVEGGIPTEHPDNALDLWCTQLGFVGFEAVEYGSRDCSAPRGQIFGCKNYDDKVWHWCDYKDGYWRDQKLDQPCPADANNLIVSITCV